MGSESVPTGRSLRRYLVAGLLLWLPVGVTFLVVRFLVGLMDQTLLLLPLEYRPDAILGFHIPGLGIVLAFGVLLATGVLAANLLGRRLLEIWEGLLDRIPFIRTIYGGAKNFAETVLSDQGKAFNKVLLVEYPKKGIWSLAFKTSEQLGEVQSKLGEKARWYGHGGTIFPNVSYSNGVQSMGTWHPCGPNETEIWRIFLAPRAAPDEVKNVLRHYVIRYQGPSGLTEQDDMENWASAHEGARGTIARRHDFHYGMGMGHERKGWPVSWLGGDIYATEDVSEQNQRAYYSRWARDMDRPPFERKPLQAAE